MTLTNRELLAEINDRTDLGLPNLIILAAKAGVAKYLAGKMGDGLVLKGGTLLHHAYGSPRVSLADADYACRIKNATQEDLMQILTFEVDGLSVDGSKGQWYPEQQIIHGDRIPFSIDGVYEPEEAGQTRATSKSKVRRLSPRPFNLSFSVRKGEVLAPPTKVAFKAEFLADYKSFEVLGVALEEMAAEKILAWSLKPLLSKHYVDLAFLARDWGNVIKQDVVVRLVNEKFQAEKTAAETSALYRSFVNPRSLLREFQGGGQKLIELERTWGGNGQSAGVIFMPGEAEASRSLCDLPNVMAIVHEFWVPLIRGLRGD